MNPVAAREYRWLARAKSAFIGARGLPAAFRLLGSVGGVQRAEKAVTFEGGYETRDGGSLQIEFRGPVTDAQPVREFIEPQLRDASVRNLEAGFELTFADGLPMAGDAAETFTERLSRFAGGAAYVSATAHAAES